MYISFIYLFTKTPTYATDRRINGVLLKLYKRTRLKLSQRIIVNFFARKHSEKTAYSRDAQISG